MSSPDLLPAVDPSARLARMQASLRGAGLESISVAEWRSGVDCWVDLVTGADGTVRVLRSPRFESLDTAYDGPTNFGAVLAREAAALGLAEGVGVPVPHVEAVHLGSGEHDPSWMLQSLLVGDDSAPEPGSDARLGAWVRTLHAVRPSEGFFEPPADWPGAVSQRITRRLDAVREFAQLPPAAALLEPLAEVLGSRQADAVSLLHLDVRPANVVYRDGHPVGLLDFANAMTGDPLFELARIRCYGGLSDDFLAGYGWSPAVPDAVARLLDLYELDSSTLLTVVGRYEADDEALHRANLERTKVLCDRLAEQA